MADYILHSFIAGPPIAIIPVVAISNDHYVPPRAVASPAVHTQAINVVLNIRARSDPAMV